MRRKKEWEEKFFKLFGYSKKIQQNNFVQNHKHYTLELITQIYAIKFEIILLNFILFNNNIQQTNVMYTLKRVLKYMYILCVCASNKSQFSLRPWEKDKCGWLCKRIIVCGAMTLHTYNFVLLLSKVAFLPLHSACSKVNISFAKKEYRINIIWKRNEDSDIRHHHISRKLISPASPLGSKFLYTRAVCTENPLANL